MKSPPSPQAPGRPWTDHAGSEAGWNISAGTRQRAQEADASMTWDDWRYAAPNGIRLDLHAAESKYFLP